MISVQRMKSDIATLDRREIADNTMRDRRVRNDELTGERRFKADRTMEKSRARNDELTADRREIKDENPGMALVVSLLILTALAIGAFFILV